MSLKPVPSLAIPEETARVAHSVFPKGHPYLAVRDQLGPLFTDETFAALFPTRGRPAESPARLALVTILQFAEGLSDRAATDAVRSRIDWKYVLGLELTDPGFDASVLVEFRIRLIAHEQTQLLFETLLQQLQAAGLVKARGRQRTDSTHVLAAVQDRNRLECVWEAMRWALQSLAQADPDWLRAVAPARWYEQYVRSPDRHGLVGQARRTYLEQIGADGHCLLETVFNERPHLHRQPAMESLRQIWVQQFFLSAEGQVTWREVPNHPPSKQMIYSPHDVEARWTYKRDTEWQGYKVHLTETIEADAPQLITDVQTAPAPETDKEALSGIQQRLAERDLLPTEHLVDAGYVTAQLLVDSQQRGVTLLGPIMADPSWQAKQNKGYAAADFQIDWERKQVLCPRGKMNASWKERQADYGMEVVYVQFYRKDCAACPARSDCTTTQTQRRTITFNTQPYYDAMQAARQRQQTPAFQKQYAARAGMEGTISQAVHKMNLRQARYRGLVKVQFQHYATAAALNLVRLGAWLQERPRAKTRSSPFWALQAA
jgi:transposase